MTTHIGFLVFPGMLQLDFTGAFGVLAAGPERTIHLVWKDEAPVITSDGLSFMPTTTIRDCPALDVMVVPGGGGIVSLLEDQEVLDFLRKQAATARYTASVCTGSLVLGAAGLLRGKRATTHWQSLPLLAPFGAEAVEERVVRDGNLLTGAGVTSGIDLGLALAALLWGEDTAMAIQLNMEYDPRPPFACGSPRTAPPALVDEAKARNAARQREREAAVTRAASRL